MKKQNKKYRSEKKVGLCLTNDLKSSKLRLFNSEKHKIEFINSELIIGEKSGETKKFENEQFKQKMRKQFNVNA